MNICKGIEELIKHNLPEILSLRNTGTLKADSTFVSKGDLLCESLILAYIKEHLPNSYVISEESVNDVSRLNDYEYVVTVDPIDGTENFVSGLREWGVGVSIYKNMRHLHSIIILPELDASLQTGDNIQRYDRSRICGLSSYMSSQDFSELDGKFEYRIMGCCMYNMYNVIKGAYAQFLHLKGAYSWDILPGINLAIEHGLSVKIDGKPYNGEFLYPNIKYHFIVGART